MKTFLVIVLTLAFGLAHAHCPEELKRVPRDPRVPPDELTLERDGR